MREKLRNKSITRTEAQERGGSYPVQICSEGNGGGKLSGGTLAGKKEGKV